MSIPFKSSSVEFNQRLLFPPNIFDLLPKDHECFLYADLFKQLDTSRLECLYSVKGQNAYYPKLIVSILIFAYSQGVFSSRKIQKRCNYEVPEDLTFKQDRLAKIQAAKQALEEREALLNPGKAIEDKKQISFADTEARIMGKKGRFDYAYNAQISVDADLQIIVGQHVSQHA